MLMEQIIVNIIDEKTGALLKGLLNKMKLSYKSLEEEELPVLSEAEISYLNKRLEEVKNNPDTGMDWEDVKKKIWF